MKIGIASCYAHHNYGSMLQAYATQKIIQNLGHDAVTIQCNKPINYMQQSKARYLYHKITNPDIVRKKIRELKGKIELNKHADIKSNITIRSQKFTDFYLSNINLSKLCPSRSALEELASSFDAVVVGSDMLWHPINVEHDYYTLSFVPNAIKKISYATSFGTTSIPKYQINKYKDFLSKFSSISVREKSGIAVIKNLGINKEVQVVLDPTLLFDQNDWIKLQANKPFINEDYIFCYFLGVNPEHRWFAQELKKTTGYKIVTLQHLDEFIKNDIGYADLTPYNVGPSEFINLISNAQFVCTDSFHGTCFSILHHKNFYTFNRFNSANTQSTNTRIDSLLSMTGLEDRRISINNRSVDIDKYLNREVQYKDVDKKLKDKRNQSIKYLRDAILN